MQQCKKCWAAARSVAANAHCTLNSFDRNHTSFASLNFRTMQVINYHLFGAASSHFHVPVFATNGSPLQTNRHEIRIRKLMHRHNSSLPLDGTSIITIENKFWRGISNRPAQKNKLEYFRWMRTCRWVEISVIETRKLILQFKLLNSQNDLVSTSGSIFGY